MLLTGAKPLYQGINSLAMQQGLRERHRNVVLNLADPRGCPGSFLRRLFLRIGTDRPMQDDLAALHFDCNTAGIHLRVAYERLLDFLLQVGWREARLDLDEIDDSSDT